jgi:hypothetical protein
VRVAPRQAARRNRRDAPRGSLGRAGDGRGARRPPGSASGSSTD